MDPEAHIPPHLQDFHLVFSKESFDKLPEAKPWDHTVELTSDASPKGCKVYLLSVSEQKELDIFLKENLDSGRIRPSSHQWPLLSSSSKRRMASSAWSRITMR